MSRAAEWIWSLLLLAALWCCGIYLMYTHDYVFCYETLSCPISPMASVRGGITYLTAQTVMLYVLLRPITFRLSWGRAAIAWVVFAGWFYFVGLGVMHSPGWYVANLIWLLMVLLGLSVLVITTSGIVLVRRFKHAPSGI